MSSVTSLYEPFLMEIHVSEQHPERQMRKWVANHNPYPIPVRVTGAVVGYVDLMWFDVDRKLCVWEGRVKQPWAHIYPSVSAERLAANARRRGAQASRQIRAV